MARPLLFLFSSRLFRLCKEPAADGAYPLSMVWRYMTPALSNLLFTLLIPAYAF